ncbi:MAG: hypothetical protein WDM89_02640 [Rhizomicrobium sp.]
MKLAEEHGLNGPYIQMLHTVERVLPEAIGRSLPININGAIPAILLEIGFPLSALKKHFHSRAHRRPACTSS